MKLSERIWAKARKVWTRQRHLSHWAETQGSVSTAEHAGRLQRAHERLVMAARKAERRGE